MELRPCIVTTNADQEKKAFFHRWEDVSYPVDASPLVGGHPGGFARRTLAIVEFENGVVGVVEPYDVRFTDGDPNQEGWHSVNDGFPEETGWYLCFCSDAVLKWEEQTRIQLVYYIGGNYGGFDEDFTVLYWMPLPKAPKKGEQK